MAVTQIEFRPGSGEAEAFEPFESRNLWPQLGSRPTVIQLFFWDGWQCVEEYTAAGARTKRFVFGEGIDEVVKATVPDVNDVDSDMNTSEELDLYYHQNSLGSVAAVTDLNGTVVEEYSYTAYGELTVDTKVGTTTGTGTATHVAQPFGFTGRRHDYEEGSGLFYYRLRYYDPVAGRFVSRDPLGLWGDPGQRGNGQSYCSANPVNRVDPLGLQDAAAQNRIKQLLDKYNDKGDLSQAEWDEYRRLMGRNRVQTPTPDGLEEGMESPSDAKDEDPGERLEASPAAPGVPGPIQIGSYWVSFSQWTIISGYRVTAWDPFRGEYVLLTEDYRWTEDGICEQLDFGVRYFDTKREEGFNTKEIIILFEEFGLEGMTERYPIYFLDDFDWFRVLLRYKRGGRSSLGEHVNDLVRKARRRSRR